MNANQHFPPVFRVSSYFPFPNYRLMPGFSGSFRKFLKFYLRIQTTLKKIFGTPPRLKKYSLGDIFCKFLKVFKKMVLIFPWRKRQKRTSQFFFSMNNIIEWKFLDFPSVREIPGHFPFFPGTFNFPANYRFSQFSRSLDTLVFDRAPWPQRITYRLRHPCKDSLPDESFRSALILDSASFTVGSVRASKAPSSELLLSDRQNATHPCLAVAYFLYLSLIVRLAIVSSFLFDASEYKFSLSLVQVICDMVFFFKTVFFGKKMNIRVLLLSHLLSLAVSNRKDHGSLHGIFS